MTARVAVRGLGGTQDQVGRVAADHRRQHLRGAERVGAAKRVVAHLTASGLVDQCRAISTP
jgi:hypothetical protein